MRTMFAKSQPDARPVVIAGLTLNGGTVLRRMQQLGYAAWGVSSNTSEPGWCVGGARRRWMPDPRDDFEGWVDQMIDLAQELPQAPPLLPMSDVYVVAIDRAAPLLKEHFLLHGFGDGLRTALTSKRHTFARAAEHDFPRPASRWVENRDELASFAEEVSGPVLVKPDFTYQWRNPAASSVIGMRKVGTGNTMDSLLAMYDEIAAITPGVLAQEVIPGPDSNLLYWCGFMGPEGRVGGRLVGRKRRIVPIHYGSATFVELVDVSEVEDQCERFLAAVGYRGLCGVELKQDPRDGVAKLIEVNPRYSLWDDIGVPVGVDLAGEAVASLYGEPTVARRPRHFRQKWVELGRDLPAALEYRKEGLLSLWGWFWSLRPPIVVNDLPIIEDPGYAVRMMSRRMRKLAGELGGSTEGREAPEQVLAKPS